VGSGARRRDAVTRTLVVTNDFPPRPGGIQAFVQGLVERLPADDVVVYASSWDGADEYDAGQPFRVLRDRTSMLLLAPRLRAAGVRRLVATTHGHEVGWAALPGARSLLRRVGREVDVLTYLGDYTRTRLARALGSGVRLERLAPGVDSTVFRPDPLARAAARARLGLGERPVVVCVSRLVPRKGQDTLIRAMPAMKAAVPGAALLLVGGGPARTDLTKLVDELGLREDVVITGSQPWADLPGFYAAGDVFAMPCRTRRAGLDVEGLGIVYLEASATGLPVVAGDSGGAPDAVRAGETGVVVNGRSVGAVADAVVSYLGDPARALATGLAGRAWVEAEWTWDGSADRLAELLRG